MNKILLLLLLLVASYALNAQGGTPTCGSGRYTNDVFTNVTKTSNIIFGYNSTTDYSTLTVHPQTLQLDFYEPEGDALTSRPLIILAFGGGFISGDRTQLAPACIALAKKGYTVASIDYRLIYSDPLNLNIVAVYTTPSLLADAVVKASVDMKAAIRFFKHDAATSNTYKIDPTKIIVGGGSAGAITALQTAYVDDVTESPIATSAYASNGGFEGNTDLPAPNNLLPAYNSSGIAGVINIAGGIADTSLVDANNPPIYSAQGDADEVVPYNYGAITYKGIATPNFLYGSHLIQTRANNIGLTNQLYTIPGGAHESPLFPPYINNIIEGAAAFLTPIVCSSTLPVTLSSFAVQSDNCVAVLRWQTATEKQSSHFDIETSEDGIHFAKVATVQGKNASSGAEYSYTPEGFTKQAWFRVKMVDKDGSYTFSSVQKFKPACMASLQIYPNPAQEQATISGLETGMQVHVVDAIGKLLWTQRASGNTMHIPLTTFAKGILLVQVKDKTGKILANSKLVKN